MPTISDSELTTLQNTFALLRNVLSEVQDTSEGSAIRQQVVEAEQIISGLVNKSKNADAMAKVLAQL